MHNPAPQTPQELALHRTELALAYLLRAGVLLSSLLVLAGLALIFLRHPGYLHNQPPTPTVLKDMAFPTSLAEVYHGLLAFQGRSIILLGLFTLIATPVLRVALSVLLFLHQKDRLFAIITLLVLALLLTSFLLGKAGG